MANWSDPRQSAAPFQTGAAARSDAYDAGLRSYMLSVYNYMTSGVLLTGIVSMLFAWGGVNSPAAHVLLGVFAEPWVPKLAGALDALGTQAGLAAHGIIGPDRGIDELTTATRNRVRGVGRLSAVDGHWQAEDFGLKVSPFADLAGGDLAANLALVDAILAGRGPAGLVDTIVLNAAVALWITGKTANVRDGLGLAREQLLGGGVQRKIAATREFYRS